MKIIEPYFEILDELDGKEMLRRIERAGRVCYKSEDNAREDSAEAFVKRIVLSGHTSVIEHEKVSVRIVCDRGVSHELVRHRIASYSQESTRYCNYSNKKFGNEITVIKPNFWNEDSECYKIWKTLAENAEKAYTELLAAGATPQEARSVLPNSLKTEIIVTMNLRAWRNFFTLRCSKDSHPQMIQIARPMLDEFKRKIPVIFNDIQY